jgi:hypothetical protein
MRPWWPARAYFQVISMKLKHCRPRCEAITIKGGRCKMTEHRKGMRFCRYHDPDLRAAAIADNTRRLRAYWSGYRLAKVLAANGEA